jgi:cyclic pyranopterin phosphate synthase
MATRKNTKLSHLDDRGLPAMVDVSGKIPTVRTARAQVRIHLPPAVLSVLDGDDLHSPKGAVVHTAILAGTMAAKRTWELVPLCHPLALSKVSFSHRFEGSKLVLECETRCTGPTGVEMEALTGASVAALTVYDMCKALSHRMEIGPLRLLEKSGGKSDLEVEP